MPRYASKRQADNQPVPVPMGKIYTDQFGREVNVGDFVIFTRKAYSRDCMTGAGISFGILVKYLPSGGMVIRDAVKGDEVKILALFTTLVVKFTDDLKRSVMLAKLAA